MQWMRWGCRHPYQGLPCNANSPREILTKISLPVQVAWSDFSWWGTRPCKTIGLQELSAMRTRDWWSAPSRLLVFSPYRRHHIHHRLKGSCFPCNVISPSRDRFFWILPWLQMFDHFTPSPVLPILFGLHLSCLLLFCVLVSCFLLSGIIANSSQCKSFCLKTFRRSLTHSREKNNHDRHVSASVSFSRMNKSR
jgi:hypothetical protein